MINLRYHIVSLVAVFLALAVGVVMGSTVLEEGTVSVLRRTTKAIEQANERYRQENGRLGRELAGWERFGQELLPVLVRGRLAGQAVVLVETDQVDGVTRKAVEEVLGRAGAEVEARLSFPADRLALAEEGDRAALATVLDTTERDPAKLRAMLVELLALRLASPRPMQQDGEGVPDDLLVALSEAKLLGLEGLADPYRDGTVPFPRAGSLFVILGPAGVVTAAGTSQEFLVPLADRLAERSATPVAAVERAEGESSWVAELRSTRGAADRVVTVDDVDLVPGQVALVWALELHLAGDTAGHYGIKEGSSAVVPPQEDGT